MEGVTVGGFEIVLHVLFCELGEVVAGGFAEDGEGFGGHFFFLLIWRGFEVISIWVRGIRQWVS